jgi:hypothetical protein
MSRFSTDHQNFLADHRLATAGLEERTGFHVTYTCCRSKVVYENIAGFSVQLHLCPSSLCVSSR